jgi:bifunctional non-homologous end joining protein LigD
MRRFLRELGLESFAKTTGGKGLHLVMPIVPELEWGAADRLAKAVAEVFASSAPELYTANSAKAMRAGRVFIDYLRNGRGQTAIGGFSPRAWTRGPVSALVSWEEVRRGVRPDAFTIATLPQRLAERVRDATRQAIVLVDVPLILASPKPDARPPRSIPQSRPVRPQGPTPKQGQNCTPILRSLA